MFIRVEQKINKWRIDMKDLNKDDLYEVLKEPTLDNFRRLL